MRPHPPLGLLYLSSHLKARGFDVGVFDGTFQTIDDFARTLERERPPVVGIAVNLMTKRNALRDDRDRAKRRGAQVVIGGPDPPHYAAEYLDAGADVVVIGEGEQTLEELICRIARELGDARDVWRRSPASSSRRADGSGRADAAARAAARSRPPAVSRSRRDRSAALPGRVARASRLRHGVADHRARLPVHLHVVQPLGLRRRRIAAARSANVADEVEAIVDRYRPDRLWYADDVFAHPSRRGRSTTRAELRAAPAAPAVRVHLARRAHRRRGGRRAARAGLLARVDRIGERIAAHPRRDAAQGVGRAGARHRAPGCGGAASRSACSSCSATTASGWRTCGRRSST